MTMNIENILTTTKIVRHGMLVRDVFKECANSRVHALPYYNEQGFLQGRVTLKNIMKYSCLPEHMVELANLLGKHMSCVENAEEKAREIICNPIEPYVQELNKSISSSEPLIKALAIMERNDSSYIFVVDDNEYKGQITIQDIARVMSGLENDCDISAS